jgi:hypothetical protein
MSSDLSEIKHMWFILLLAAARAHAWCSCAGTASGSFAAVLSLQSTQNVTVVIGETVSSPNAAVFARASNPQALVMHLAAVYAGGQAIAASQLQTRCVRYTRSGFQLMATTGIVIASRNGSMLTWLHVELDLFAACSSTQSVNVFRVARPAIRVLPVDLMDLETDADPTGPLVDDTETVCRPRSSPWFNRTVTNLETSNGQAAWRLVRTIGDLIFCAKVCGPAPGDAVEGVYHARAPTRRYVQVCAFDDAVFCAADAMMLSTVITSRDDILRLNTTATRGNHIIEIYRSGLSSVTRVVFDINVANRQISSYLQLNQLTMDSGGDSLPAVNWTSAQLLRFMNATNNHLVNTTFYENIFMSNDDDVYGSTECHMNNTMHAHHCDPLVQNDRSVQFGDDPANDTYIAAGGSLPCLPAVTAVCPAVKLPPPVFSGATTAGIVVGSAVCALVIAMVAGTIFEHCTPYRRVPPRSPSPSPTLVRRETAPVNDTLVKRTVAATPAQKPVRSEPELEKTVVSLKEFWNLAGVTLHKKKL